MKNIKKFNSFENLNESKSIKDITEEDKKFFDSVFADFIDMGAKSELYETKQKGKRYRIYINLESMASKKVLSMCYVDSLLKYSTNLNELLLDLDECINKIKSENDFKLLNDFIFTNNEAKTLIRYSPHQVEYAEESDYILDRFNIILNLFHLF